MKKSVLALVLCAAVAIASCAAAVGYYQSRVLCEGWEDASVEELMQAQQMIAERLSAMTVSAQAGTGKSTRMVWVTKNGKRYHVYSGCSNMKSPKQIPLSEAEGAGYTPCQKCY